MGKRMGYLVPGAALLLALMRFAQRTRADDLAGEVALITGGSRGLGLLLAREFGRAGCKVAICARDAGELDAARRQLRQDGLDVFTVVCDVSDPVQVANAIDRTTEHFGQIDLLVNNAGVIQVGPLETMTFDDFEDAIGIIQWGTIYAALGVLPQMMRRRRGRIVNITSVGGKVSMPHLLPYNTAKFATIGFSEGLRAEMHRHGITVTTVVPGLMRTGSPLNAAFKGDEVGEFTWFSVADSLPLLSMDAEQAARRIVLATRMREPELILTLPAWLVSRVKGLFPGLTLKLLTLINRVMLPAPQEIDQPAERGAAAYARVEPELAKRLMAASLDAAQRFNQFATQPPPSAATDIPDVSSASGEG